MIRSAIALSLFASAVSANLENKTCYLDSTTYGEPKTAYKLLITDKKRQSKKEYAVGFIGYALDLQSKQLLPVNGSGYVQDNKLISSISYVMDNVPTIAFFDAYANSNYGQSKIIDGNFIRIGYLNQVPCNLYFGG